MSEYTPEQLRYWDGYVNGLRDAKKAITALLDNHFNTVIVKMIDDVYRDHEKSKP